MMDDGTSGWEERTDWMTAYGRISFCRAAATDINAMACAGIQYRRLALVVFLGARASCPHSPLEGGEGGVFPFWEGQGVGSC